MTILSLGDNNAAALLNHYELIVSCAQWCLVEPQQSFALGSV